VGRKTDVVDCEVAGKALRDVPEFQHGRPFLEASFSNDFDEERAED
jgi:hypothetical protein